MSEKILTKEDIDFSKVRDYVTFLIYNIGHEKGLSRKSIQKACFVIKKEGSENIDINKELPFYWYYYGPFSNVINDAIQIAIDDGILYTREAENHTRYYLNDLAGYKQPKHIEFDKVTKIINSLNITWFGTEDLTEWIYQKYAPRKFRYNFYKTWKILNNCAENVPNLSFRQEHLFNVYRNQIYEWLIKSEGNLPRDELFKNYLNLFSYYVMILNRVLDNKKEFSSDVIDHLDCLKTATEDVWRTFGEGERILEHDTYFPYEYLVPTWEKRYYSHLDSLGKSLYNLDDHIVEVIGEDSLKQSYTDKEKDFLVTVFSE